MVSGYAGGVACPKRVFGMKVENGSEKTLMHARFGSHVSVC